MTDLSPTYTRAGRAAAAAARQAALAGDPDRLAALKAKTVALAVADIHPSRLSPLEHSQ